jgi:hypothetical protein
LDATHTQRSGLQGSPPPGTPQPGASQLRRRRPPRHSNITSLPTPPCHASTAPIPPTFTKQHGLPATHSFSPELVTLPYQDDSSQEKQHSSFDEISEMKSPKIIRGAKWPCRGCHMAMPYLATHGPSSSLPPWPLHNMLFCC